MSLKPFGELVGIDLSSKASQKPIKKKLADGTYKEVGKLDYLSWADCLAALYENGAVRVLYGNVHNKDDHPLFLLNGGNPFVRVFVDIDGDRRELDYPVIDGSKDIKMDFLAQSDIHNATQRAFVKCVAINWGLGLSLWMKEEKDTESMKTPDDDIAFHSTLKVKLRIEQLFTVKLQNGKAIEEIYAAFDNAGDAKKGEKTYSTILKALQSAVVLEQKLKAL